MMTLAQLTQGSRAVVCHMHHPCERMQRRLLDIGLIVGTEVVCVQHSPFGTIKAYEIRGAVIALRAEDATAVTLAAHSLPE